MIPANLYRYRPLDDALFDREIGALEGAFLWSPHFSEMNDPMEAFYELGGPSDAVLDLLFAPSGKSTADIYRMAQNAISSFSLISFSGSYLNLPMWAYYASNFAGMCLEFATDELFIGDLQNERLMPVTYAADALPPIPFHQLESIQQAMEARLSRKRLEWQHEQEWRVLTGAKGPRHYLDDALRRILLGPRVSDAHAERICRLFEKRPTEILRGRVSGFDLQFDTIKTPLALHECERLGDGKLDLNEIIFDQKEMEEFLAVPFSGLVGELEAIAARPNTQEIVGCDLSGAHNKNAIYVWSQHKLRSGRVVWNRRYYDRHLSLVASNS